MNDADRIIAKFLRRLNIGNFLKRMGEWLAVGLFMFGMAVLVVRLLSPGLWPGILWLSAGVLPVGYLAWRFSRQQSFTRRESIALFDSKMQSGGLLMTMTECSDNSWDEYLSLQEEEWHSFLPRIRPMRFLKVISVPMLFFVAVCLIPLQSHSEQIRERGMMQQKTTLKLQQMLDKYMEAQLLDPEEAEKFREEIQKLKDQNTDSAMTHERWETADTIEAKLNQQAEKAVRTMQQAQQSLEKLNDDGTQSEGISKNQKGNKTKAGTPQISPATKQNNGKKLTEEQRNQHVENVSNALKMLLENQSELLSMLSPEMMEGIKEMMKQQNRLEFPEDSGLRNQMMQELQKLMQSESKRLQEMMQKLQESGQLEELQKILGQYNKPGNKIGLGANPSSNPSGQQPGNKGISRGPGTSPINGTNNTLKTKANFRDIILPPGFHDKTKKETVRVEIEEPKVESNGKTTRENRRIENGTSDLESFKRRIRPKHRRAVRKYFESKKKK